MFTECPARAPASSSREERARRTGDRVCMELVRDMSLNKHNQLPILREREE